MEAKHITTAGQDPAKEVYEEGIRLLADVKKLYSDEEVYGKIVMNLKNVLTELHALRVKQIVGNINTTNSHENKS